MLAPYVWRTGHPAVVFTPIKNPRGSFVSALLPLAATPGLLLRKHQDTAQMHGQSQGLPQNAKRQKGESQWLRCQLPSLANGRPNSAWIPRKLFCPYILGGCLYFAWRHSEQPTKTAAIHSQWFLLNRASWWFQPTCKNMNESNWIISPENPRENFKKYLSCHHSAKWMGYQPRWLPAPQCEHINPSCPSRWSWEPIPDWVRQTGGWNHGQIWGGKLLHWRFFGGMFFSSCHFTFLIATNYHGNLRFLHF